MLVLLVGCFVGEQDLQDRLDADGDGFVAAIHGGPDCDDADPDVHPRVTDDDCDGLDDNCDGEPDDAVVIERWLDVDGDGQGDPASPLCDVDDDEGVDNAEDCDDLDVTVFSGAFEACNGIDDDCDGEVDDGIDVYEDVDRDGFGGDAIDGPCVGPGRTEVDGDCDDDDPDINPDAFDEPCDGVDGDCDGADDVVAYYEDADGDGFGGPVVVDETCSGSSAGTPVGGDCDDTDANVNPDAAEACDGVDANCDGVADDDLRVEAWLDTDGDGATGGAALLVCPDQLADLNASTTFDGDCAPDDATVHPGVPEVCDGRDNDCNGGVDDGDVGYEDADGDGFAGDDPVPCNVSDSTQPGGDCDDGDNVVFPGAAEDCGGKDRDCDGDVDGPDPFDGDPLFPDEDNDGFGDDNVGVQLRCDGDGVVSGGDCDDNDDFVNPNRPEICGDGIDNDCTYVIDDGNDTVWEDNDGDGFGDLATQTFGCAGVDTFVNNGADCDDGDPNAFPNAVWYEDLDGDDWGNDAVTQISCLPPPGPWAWHGGDCDDSVLTGGSVQGNVYYPDVDLDTWGDESEPHYLCTGMSGLIPLGQDCDDADDTVHPGADELCNGVDDDCNGPVDDNAVDANTDWWFDWDRDGFGSDQQHPDVPWCVGQQPPFVVDNSDDCDDDDDTVLDTRDWYLDDDSDGYGADGVVETAGCEPPGPSRAAVAGDCDDSNEFVHPDAFDACADPTDSNCDGANGEPEICGDGIDNDCNTQVDENAVGVPHWPDLDMDGYGDPGGPSVFCEGEMLADNDEDCDDTDDNTSPDAEEYCDEQDNDCDDLIDEDDPDLIDGEYVYDDLDFDGVGADDDPGRWECDFAPGVSFDNDDCDDSDDSVFPGALDIPLDGIDQDCDLVDDGRIFAVGDTPLAEFLMLDRVAETELWSSSGGPWTGVAYDPLVDRVFAVGNGLLAEVDYVAQTLTTLTPPGPPHAPVDGATLWGGEGYLLYPSADRIVRYDTVSGSASTVFTVAGAPTSVIELATGDLYVTDDWGLHLFDGAINAIAPFTGATQLVRGRDGRLFVFTDAPSTSLWEVVDPTGTPVVTEIPLGFVASYGCVEPDNSGLILSRDAPSDGYWRYDFGSGAIIELTSSLFFDDLAQCATDLPFDADADGERSIAHGGNDCDDFDDTTLLGCP